MMSETSDLGRAVGDGDGRWFATQGANGRGQMRDVSGEEIAPDYQGAFRPAVFLYDNHPGGIGLSEPLYARQAEVVRGALELVERCDCRYGCPSCVGPVLASDEERGYSPRALAATVLGLFAAAAEPALQVGMNLAGRSIVCAAVRPTVTPDSLAHQLQRLDGRRTAKTASPPRIDTLGGPCSCGRAARHCCCASAGTHCRMPTPAGPDDAARGARSGRSRLVYLDTETTGLSGGVGNLAFMVGVARYTTHGRWRCASTCSAAFPPRPRCCATWSTGSGGMRCWSVTTASASICRCWTHAVRCSVWPMAWVDCGIST